MPRKPVAPALVESGEAMFDWTPSRRATLHDVARAAGVSVSVVSSVLNGGCANTRSSEATRDRVRKAATDLGYRPNELARSLRYRVTNTIGLYNGLGYVDARNPFLNAVLAGLHHRCDHHLCDLLIHRLSRQNDTPQRMQEVIGGKVDGAIVYTFHNDPVVAMLAERHFPAVAIADEHPLVPSVTADDAGGSRMVAEHLAAKGHKRILYRMPPPAVSRTSAENRFAGFLDAAVKLGMTVEIGTSDLLIGDFSEAEEAVMLRPESSRPTAVVSWVDGSAYAAYVWLRNRGLDKDVAVIGFDGFEVPNMPCYLTTVVVDWTEVAEIAVDVVRQVIAGKPVPSRTIVPVKFRIGETG